MKKFRYRLAPLLTVREHTEKQRQKEHAQALQQVYDQQQMLQQTARRIRETVAAAQAADSDRPNVVLAQMASRYVAKLRRDSINGTELLRAYQTEAERRRLLLVEATKEKRKLEKYRDKLKERYYRELDLVERKELDEVAGRAFVHRQAGR